MLGNSIKYCPVCRKPAYDTTSVTLLDSVKVHIECFFDETIPQPAPMTDPQQEEKTAQRKAAIEERAVYLLAVAKGNDIQPVTFTPDDPQPPHICEENKRIIPASEAYGGKEITLYKFKGGVYTTDRHVNPNNAENGSYNVYSSHGRNFAGRIIEDAGLGFRVGNGERYAKTIDERIESIINALGLAPHFEEKVVKYSGQYWVLERITNTGLAKIWRNGVSEEVSTAQIEYVLN